jgi:hypothetical protein
MPHGQIGEAGHGGKAKPVFDFRVSYAHGGLLLSLMYSIYPNCVGFANKMAN